jgi:hypothetical protein
VPLAVDCPSCNARIQVPERLAGRKIRCTTCREEFRVGDVGRPRPVEDDYDDDSPRLAPRRRSSSPLMQILVPIIIVGGVLGALVAVAVVVALTMNRPNAQPPIAAPGGPLPNVPGQPAVANGPMQAAEFLTPHTILPPRKPGAFGRSDQPTQGTILVTLSKLRRRDDGDPGRPSYLVDFKWTGQPPRLQNSYLLYVKIGDKMGDAHIHFDEDKMTGKFLFDFFPGSDPGGAFDIWIGKRLLDRGNWTNTRYSNVLTLQ